MDHGVKQLKQSRITIMVDPWILEGIPSSHRNGKTRCDKDTITFLPIPLQRPTQTKLRDEVPFRGWDCHNPHFQDIFPEHYSPVTIHQLLFIGHYSSFYYSSFLDSVSDSEKRYYSHDTIHPGRENTIHGRHTFHRKPSLRVFKFEQPVWFGCEFIHIQ